MESEQQIMKTWSHQGAEFMLMSDYTVYISHDGLHWEPMHCWGLKTISFNEKQKAMKDMRKAISAIESLRNELSEYLIYEHDEKKLLGIISVNLGEELLNLRKSYKLIQNNDK